VTWGRGDGRARGGRAADFEDLYSVIEDFTGSSGLLIEDFTGSRASDENKEHASDEEPGNINTTAALCV
jgi:hypothetical protein